MKALSENWFAEGTIDFEYKQYLLLAYLEEVKRQYAALKLYPVLSDLIGHYRSLVLFRDNKFQLTEKLPKKLTGIDPSQLSFTYHVLHEDDEIMQELDQIVAYSLPKVQFHVEKGTELYEKVEEKLLVEPIGVVPLYKHEGYLLIRVGAVTDIIVYQFKLSLIDQGEEKAKALHTRFVTTYQYSLTNGYEQIKLDLVRSKAELPNPATYAMESTLAVPLEETLLPIAKRRLLRMIA
jgi:hypothetical protein